MPLSLLNLFLTTGAKLRWAAHVLMSFSYARELPDEIWEVILRGAASILEESEKRDYISIHGLDSAPLPPKGSHLEHYIAFWSNVLATRQALVCVCRLWWQIATPFLYSSICIHFKTIQGHSRRVYEPLGQFPDIRQHVVRWTFAIAIPADKCSHVIAMCSNITCLSVPMNMDWDVLISGAPGVSTLPNLRVLRVAVTGWSAERRQYTQVVGFLVEQQKLEVLSLKVWDCLVDPMNNHGLRLPHLHSLELIGMEGEPMYRWLQHSHLPSLRILSLPTINLDSATFLQNVSPTIEILQVQKPHWHPYKVSVSVLPTHHIHFPHLRHLALYQHTSTSSPGTLPGLIALLNPAPPKLRRVVITGVETLSVFARTFEFLELLTSNLVGEGASHWLRSLTQLRLVLPTRLHDVGGAFEAVRGYQLDCETRAKRLGLELEIRDPSTRSNMRP